MKYHVCPALLAFALLTTNAGAALIDVDWAFPGDNSLMQDTSTNLQWLDLSLSDNKSYNLVISQLQPGGVYDGFRYATRDEVLHLWSEAGITDTGFAWVNNGEYPIVSDMVNRLGWSVLDGIHIHTLGIVEGGPPLPANERWVMELSYNHDGVQVRTSSDYYTLDTDFASPHYSSYLVRAVPVPPALLLFASGLCLFAANRKKVSGNFSPRVGSQ